MVNEGDEKKLTRLTDMEVNHVAFVDRGANKRRFLVVKRDQGADEMPQGMEVKDRDGKKTAKGEVNKLSIPKPVKEKMVSVLTETQERLLSLINTVKEAEGSEEESSSPVPADVGEEIEKLTDLLKGLTEKYPSPQSKRGEELLAQVEELTQRLDALQKKAEESKKGEEPEGGGESKKGEEPEGGGESKKAEEQKAEEPKDDSVLKAIDGLASKIDKDVGAIRSRVESVSERIAKLEKSEAPPQSGSGEGEVEEDDETWPADLNDPRLDKDEVEKADGVSFFD